MKILFTNLTEQIDQYNIMIKQLNNIRNSYILYFSNNDGTVLKNEQGQPFGHIKITIFPEYFSNTVEKGSNVWEIEELICPKQFQQILINKAKQLGTKIVGDKAILNISEPTKFTEIVFSNIINQGGHHNDKSDDIQK